ncbi:hypothetical protein DFAR_1180018 [Desulfarculales bacterium]
MIVQPGAEAPAVGGQDLESARQELITSLEALQEYLVVLGSSLLEPLLAQAQEPWRSRRQSPRRRLPPSSSPWRWSSRPSTSRAPTRWLRGTSRPCGTSAPRPSTRPK